MSDEETAVEQKSVLEKVYDHIKESGYEVYYPGQKKGECLKEYVVLKMDGGNNLAGISSERPVYTVMCYVPENRYNRLHRFVLELKDVMRGVYPMLMYAGNETPSYFDSSIKGHMISFQYQGIRKIRHIL